MATKSSFKQPCPSCEAMVPIRDPKLIGRKIDCPKCKYRFVVEEPADEVDEVEEVEDEEPKKGKSKATGITSKKPVNGKAAKPATRRPDDDEDEEEATPKKKKSGGSPMLIVGIGLAAVAVVALAVGAVFLFSGDKPDSPKSSGGSASMPPPNAGASGETKKTDAKEEPPAPRPRQEDVTNLLPNDSQAVLNLPLQQMFAHPRIKQALLHTPGAFSEAAFQRIWGVGPNDVQRVVLAYNTEKKTVFSVMRTKAALKEEQIVAALKLKPEAPVGGAKYYLLTRPLDTLSMFLLHDAMPLMLFGNTGLREKVALHFIDPFTVVCANAGPMNQFLQDKGQPKHLTKTPEEEAASNAPAAPSGPAGMPGPGGPAGMPGPGGPGRQGMPGPGGMSPGGPPSTGKAGGPGAAGAPGASGAPGMTAPGGPGGPGGMTPGGPPSTGKAGGPPSTGKAGGPPSTGKASGPPSTGKASGGYQPPAGMPPGGMMPPGMHPGSGGSTSDAAPVSSSYLTIEPELKAVFDQIEKVDSQEGQAVLLSLVFSTKAVSLEDVKKGFELQGDKVPKVPNEGMNIALELFQSQVKAAGLAITELNDSKLDVNAAIAAKDAKLAKDWETIANAASVAVTAALATRGIDLVSKSASQTRNPGGGPPGMGPGMAPGMGPGMAPGMGPGMAPGMGPGMAPGMGPGMAPGMGPGGMRPPGGGFPGMQGANEEKKEEKGKDGEFLFWTKDEVLALGVHYKMNKDRYKKGGEALDFATIYLCNMTASADRRSRIHELAAALQAYFEKEGHFPRGAMQRNPGLHVIDWRPDQRLSWMTQILPYLGNGEYQALLLNPNETWYENLGNVKAGFTVIPQFLAAGSISSPLLPYPNIPSHGPGLWAATHFIGIAGVGMDAAEYRADDQATAKLRGVFGYDRETKKADITDGLAQTIVAIQVPPEPKSPWIAGGGSTVRGISDDLDCVRPFVCAKYPNKDGKEVDGTFAIMGDFKVRFIPATIDPKTFQALCTIAGEDKVSNLDSIAPEVPPPDDLPQQSELKTEQPAPSVKPPVSPPAQTSNPPAEGGSAPANPELRANMLKRIGLAYHNHVDARGKPPTKAEDLAPFYENDAGVTAALKSGAFVVFWNASFRDMKAGTSNTVLGYEKEAPEKGGLVLIADGSVRPMNANAFKAAVKASGK
jgi:flagellar basal body-associated protein FliL